MRSTERNTRPDGAGPHNPPVSVLGRAVAVLKAFDENAPVLGISEISRRTGLPKSTVHRLVAELVDQRVLEHGNDPGTYRLGGWLYEVGRLVPGYRSLSEIALPVMEDLREVTHQRIHLAVLDGVDAVYVEILGSAQVQAPSRTGGRIPAHATGVGKVILAYSPVSVLRARIEAGLPRLTPRTITTPGALTHEMRKIRTVGTALDLEEASTGVSCVAAPVFGADRKVAAGLSVTGPTRSIDPGALGPAVRTAAFTLSRMLRKAGI